MMDRAKDRTSPIIHGTSDSIPTGEKHLTPTVLPYIVELAYTGLVHLTCSPRACVDSATVGLQNSISMHRRVSSMLGSLFLYGRLTQAYGQAIGPVNAHLAIQNISAGINVYAPFHPYETSFLKVPAQIATGKDEHKFECPDASALACWGDNLRHQFPSFRR